MCKLKFQLDRKSLEIIYTSFIRPLLEYSNVVWDNCTQYEVNDLEKIQNKAARIVKGATKLTSLQSLYIETGWEIFASRRQKSTLVLFYKMQNAMTPEHLSSLAHPTVGSTPRYRLCNESDLHTIPARSQQYSHSFLPSVTRAWNRLSEETKTSPSITTFKHKLNRDVKKTPQYYYCGKRLRQIHHTPLRLNCSSLQQNLF